MSGAAHHAVQAQGVWKIFNEGQSGEVTALQDVSLTVEDGEFISLIGPSGCGKSTLLRVIADLTSATRGDMKVAGVTPHEAREKQLYGMAFQQAALFEWRTVRRNVELPLELMGWAKDRRRARAMVRRRRSARAPRRDPSRRRGRARRRWPRCARRACAPD